MKLSKETIKEINRHTSPNNMLVANKAGLYRLDVPIKVQCAIPVNSLEKGQVVEVGAVRLTMYNQIV